MDNENHIPLAEPRNGLLTSQLASRGLNHHLQIQIIKRLAPPTIPWCRQRSVHNLLYVEAQNIAKDRVQRLCTSGFCRIDCRCCLHILRSGSNDVFGNVAGVFNVIQEMPKNGVKQLNRRCNTRSGCNSFVAAAGAIAFRIPRMKFSNPVECHFEYQRLFERKKGLGPSALLFKPLILSLPSSSVLSLLGSERHR